MYNSSYLTLRFMEQGRYAELMYNNRYSIIIIIIIIIIITTKAA